MNLVLRESMVTECLGAIRKVSAACVERAAAHAGVLHSIGDQSKRSFELRAKELWTEARDWAQIGIPPGLRKLCGIRHLEVPMNRVLGWLLDPHGSHGAGHHPLALLAKHLEFAALEADVVAIPRVQVEVFCQQNPPNWPGATMPDLVVRTPSAALVFENKVNAPESGKGQYDTYLRLLHRWAGPRKTMACLCAPDERDAPPGYQVVTHAKVASLFEKLLTSSELPAWTVVVLAMAANDLREDDALDRAWRCVQSCITVGSEALGPRETIELARSLTRLETTRPRNPLLRTEASR